MPWWLDINQIFNHFLNWVTTSILNSFDAIFLMTQGGPGTASTNLPYYIYQRAFEGFDSGQSSAMGVIVVILTMIVATFGSS